MKRNDCALLDPNSLAPTNLTLPKSLVFSSLISAVDPVAVLAIFEEIKVSHY